jgi:putative colanic acid biosynthesis UDP-glucose lipid carrier transferase
MEISGYKIEHKNIMWFLHRVCDTAAIILGYIIASMIIDVSFLENEYSRVTVTLVFIISIVVYPAVGVYRPWRGEKRTSELMVIITAWLVTMSIAIVLSHFLGFVGQGVYQFLFDWTISGLFTSVVFRLGTRQFLLKFRRRGYNLRHIIIVGGGKNANDVINTVEQSKWTGYKIAGYFSNESLQADCPRLGSIEELTSFIEQRKIDYDELWVALPLIDAPQVSNIIKQLKFLTCDIRYIPDLTDFNLINHSVSSVAGMPLINLSVSPMTGTNILFKSIEDKIIASIILLLISPILLLIATAVKLTSAGPIFYKQERVGWNNKPFNMVKFRSMAIDAEFGGIQWGGAQSMKVTPIGNFIRSTSLDELPQFINVLTGDMSIVGPRPERKVFVEKFKHEIPGYMQKHMVKAGITGLAQIRGWRGDTDLNKRIESDLDYIKNWSLLLDIKIIFLTVFKGFINKNAR